MLYRCRRMAAYWRFNQAIRAIRRTPPMRVVDAPWTIASMVAANHVPMYLLCLKAFYRRIGRGKVVAIVARDMPAEALDALRHHIPGIEIQQLERIDVGDCQRGGTWERLLWILDRSRHEYVVQLDADVLAVAPDIDEVLHCIEGGVAFTMADGHRIGSMAEAAAFARTLDGDHIGDVVERVLDLYPGHEGLRYVRGSSGLAGFAPGGHSREAISRFHAGMEALVGAQRWRGWGTEQCGSNFAIANTPGAVVLPYPEYASFRPPMPHGRTKCFHFIGTYRFKDGVFAALGRREIEGLGSGEGTGPPIRQDAPCPARASRSAPLR